MAKQAKLKKPSPAARNIFERALAGEPPRISTGIPSLDDVLGGGLIPGGTVALASDPGLGKTTLCAQAAVAIVKGGDRAFIASGEQSSADLKAMFKRIGGLRGVKLMGDCGDVYEIADAAAKLRPALLVVDSLQTAHVSDVGGDVGSRQQVRAAVNWLTSFAKMEEIAVIMICHTRKDGGMAEGIENLVDAVVYLKTVDDVRQLEVVKNRRGRAPLDRLVRMTERGFAEIEK